MKKFILVCLLAILFAILFGCAKQPSKNGLGIELSDGNGSALVQEVRLSDGTRCATLIGYYKGAISCDWQGNKVTQK